MENIISLILYILVFLFAFYGVRYTQNEQNRFKKILPWIPLLIVFTFRLGVGTDYYNYYNITGNVHNIGFVEFVLRQESIEIGQNVIYWISKFFNNFNVFLFLNLSMIVYLFNKAIQNIQIKKLYAFSIFVFLTFFFLAGMNIGFQFIATGFIFLSYEYILERKFWKFMGMVVLAALFHSSALLFLPIYFLWSKKQDVWYYFYLIVAIGVFTVVVLNYQSLLGSGLLGEDYQVYSSFTADGANRDIFVKGAILAATLIFSKQLIALNPNNKFFVILLIMGFIIGLTGFSSTFVKRIGIYFDISQIILLPQLCLIFYGNQKKLIYILVFWACIAYLILVYLILGNAHVFPYEFGILGW